MKKYLIILAFFFIASSNAQNYNDLVNYSMNGIPTYGVKIKTNLPFLPFSQMPTINIMGFNYGTAEPINLTIVYYIYYTGSDSGDPSSYIFRSCNMSSSGSYTPQVYLCNENGKVSIYINDKVYFQRFSVSVFEKGMSVGNDWLQGWTIVDEPMAGTKIVEIPYQNRFKGNIFLSGGGIWNTDGNVGIGTENPDAKLAVNGTIHSKEVKVDLNVPAPDYVFANNYKLRSLQEVENYVNKNSHLPEIPSAQEFEKNGIHIAEMNMALLKKVEELTLYVIEQNKRLDTIEKENKVLRNEVNLIKKK